jgi:hypothetical protein
MHHGARRGKAGPVAVRLLGRSPECARAFDHEPDHLCDEHAVVVVQHSES